MCLGTFSRLRRSLATSTLYATVRILAERFLLYRKAISCKAKNPRQNDFCRGFFISLSVVFRIFSLPRLFLFLLVLFHILLNIRSIYIFLCLVSFDDYQCRCLHDAVS